MMPAPNSDSTLAARLKIVEEHVRLENAHDLEGVMGTFGEIARYDDEPWGAHYSGREEVREFYAQLMRALPDLQIDIRRRHASEECIILETVIRGRHLGTWRGLPATGRQIEFPLCGVFSFDQDNRLAGEMIYYDRATVLRQLGVFHDPESLRGRITTALAHPVTMARIVLRKYLKFDNDNPRPSG
jgi:steroid delta-isomerase-like uncharacterized protein